MSTPIRLKVSHVAQRFPRIFLTFVNVLWCYLRHFIGTARYISRKITVYF